MYNAEQQKLYTALKRAIDEQYDIADMHLSALVIYCIDHEGKIPDEVRARYAGKYVTGETLDAIEGLWVEVKEKLNAEQLDDNADSAVSRLSTKLW